MNPYETLGVNRNATTSEIKSAYRKLALKFHPDKQRGSEEDRAKAAAIFTKISNAYEIVSDNEARAKYDSGGFASSSESEQHQRQRHNQQANNGRSSSQRGSPFDDPFFASDPFASFHQRKSNRGQHHQFTDPFDLFNSVFAEEFGSSSRGSFNGRSAFDEDPFFSSGPSDPFARRNSSGLGGFGMMDQMMSSMMNNHRDMFNHHHQSSAMPRGGGGGGGMHQVSSSSFSSSDGGGRRGSQQSVSTRTMIVNGRKKTITERTIVKPDGTVETHVEETVDDDFPSNQFLDNRRRPSRNVELQRHSSRQSRK